MITFFAPLSFHSHFEAIHCRPDMSERGDEWTVATDAAVCLSRMRCVVLSVSIRIAMFKFKVVNLFLNNA